MTWPTSWPAPFHPLTLVRVDNRDVPDAEAAHRLVPDETVTVTAFQLRPDLVEACAAWCDGTVLPAVNGGAAVLAGGRGPAAQRIGGLGDVFVQLGEQRYRAIPAAQIAAQYQPADA